MNKTMRKITHIILIIISLTLFFTMVASASSYFQDPDELRPKIEESEEPLYKSIINAIGYMICGTIEQFIISLIIWIVIKIVQLNHFFKLFSIHKETLKTNEKLEKLIALQQAQLDLLIHGKVKEDAPEADPPKWKSYFE